MNHIEDIVASLEEKINLVISKNKTLKQRNLELEQELQQHHQKIKSQQDQLTHWEKEYETLKFANTLLGSDENKRETKLKINALIREIDHCIAQLSK